MRLRGWLSVAAAVGVLLHATVIVRHNVVMNAAAWQAHALLADLAGSLCLGTPGPERPSGPTPPSAPIPSDTAAACQACLGLASAFVVAEEAPEASPPAGAAAPAFVVAVAPPALPRAARPPPRGPPATRA
jgi:hypothetical protein